RLLERRAAEAELPRLWWRDKGREEDRRADEEGVLHQRAPELDAGTVGGQVVARRGGDGAGDREHDQRCDQARGEGRGSVPDRPARLALFELRGHCPESRPGSAVSARITGTPSAPGPAPSRATSTARMPSSRAPTMSLASESPTCSARSGGA